MSTPPSKLAELAASLKVAPKTSNQKNILFLGTFEDKQYLPYIKGMFNGINTFVCTEPISLLTHLRMYCEARKITAIVSTSTTILAKLLDVAGNTKPNPSLDNYAGSVFTDSGRDIVFINPLKQILTVNSGAFIARRYISKVAAPDSWTEPTDFSWNLLTASTLSSAYAELENAYAIAVDIETFKNPLSIRCIGYTGVFIDAITGNVRTNSYDLPVDSSFALTWMRKINDLPAQKIFQNGKYDNVYLLRYNAPVRNWLWDTAHYMHSTYSELPKDLAFLNAFHLRKVVYWKDLAETNDLHEYYKYNALDTWATANVWIRQLIESPDYARRNYLLEFPLVFPCLLAEMTGIERDMDVLSKARTEVDGEEFAALNSLQKMVGSASFNPGSPPQTKLLLGILGCKDLESSNEKDIKKAQLRHPLNQRILDTLLTIRGLRKLASTYLRTETDAKQTGIHKGEGGGKEFFGRILYSLNPHGTDTGRLASREHAFWCGLQIQNIPRGPEVKQTLRASVGFCLGGCDLEQAESRDTANISGDVALIAAVSGTRDFHSVNASAFFGVSYESIYDDTTGKTKNKKLRDLAKRVNHGANYNMGPGVLIDTMGADKIWEAGRLLKLPYTDLRKIAEHLLATFHKTYPAIKGAYYVSVINEISTTRMLTSRAYHHTEYNCRNYTAREYIEMGDWTRYCFGKPDKNKSDLNSYVAHCPQSLNARTLNEAFLRVFYEIALPNAVNFRLHAQIHDSILFSYAPNRKDLADKVRDAMEISVTIRDVSGTYRTFTVPAALKLGTPEKPATYWSETE